MKTLTKGYNFNKNERPVLDISAFDKNAVLTGGQVQSDKTELINNVEITHPAFVIKEIAGYEAAKRKFLNADIKNGGVLYIRSRAMSDDGGFSDCIGFIKNAVKSGITKAIIDVTGNGGGNDNYGYGILDALGFCYGKMGFTIRYSEATAKYRGTSRTSGYKTVQPFKYRSGNKHGVELKIFCDELTASAGMSVVNQCRYSDLGEILGRTPGQNTNFFGNALIFQLARSKTLYRLPLSYGYFERDGQKAPDILTVDIDVPASANYMDFVSWKS
jgi:hypothetical protein